MKFRFVKYLSVVILAAFALAGCENGMDDNGNGKWDSGNYENKQQPEEVCYYPRM